MPKSSRWMGTRYAMVRHAEHSEIVTLRKASAADNIADIVTKCLGGEAFKINRARILGQSYHPLPNQGVAKAREETTQESDDTPHDRKVEARESMKKTEARAGFTPREVVVPRGRGLKRLKGASHSNV